MVVVVVNLVLTVVLADLVVVVADLHIVIHQEQLVDLHRSVSQDPAAVVAAAGR